MKFYFVEAYVVMPGAKGRQKARLASDRVPLEWVPAVAGGPALAFATRAAAERMLAAVKAPWNRARIVEEKSVG